MNAIQRTWKRVLDPEETYRINDFDGDLKFDVNMGETMGANLWHMPDRYEPYERRAFCSSITAGCAVLDAGANIGLYTLLAAKRGARVFAIEADPDNAARLRHHVDLNRLAERVQVFEMAAIDREADVLLHRNPSNCGGSSMTVGEGSIPCKGNTIDSLNLPPIDVCKMDIEGSELSALSGMRETLSRSPDLKMLVEYNFLSDRPALLSWLHNHFEHVTIPGRIELIKGQAPPRDCNLWCY
jgi:FkbM family methyltransferase